MRKGQVSKYCGVCGAERIHNGKRFFCKPCANRRSLRWQVDNKERANKKNREWRSNNLDKALLKNRLSKVKKIYGIDKEQYFKMLEAHNHCCAICGEKETVSLKGTVWSLSVDHCHKTGRIRGLLCAQCNVGLAKFKENVSIFLRAIEYLEKSKN